jgi:hypothetical protein
VTYPPPAHSALGDCQGGRRGFESLLPLHLIFIFCPITPFFTPVRAHDKALPAAYHCGIAGRLSSTLFSGETLGARSGTNETLRALLVHDAGPTTSPALHVAARSHR